MNSYLKLPSLTNGQFELVVSPDTGRIVRYGAVGGANVLWEHPGAGETASPFVGWVNWGGDKVWLWPEQDWPAWNGGRNAPPGDPPTVPYEVQIDGRFLRMVSPVLPSCGLRIVREIKLAATGSAVTLVNRVEKMPSETPSVHVGAWVVTQIPAPLQAAARLLDDDGSPRYQSFPEGEWRDVKAQGDIVVLTRAATPWAKIGLEADLLAAPVGQWLFVARAPAHANSSGPYQPCCRAQVFSDPDDSPFRHAGVPAYIELEFTSPVRPLTIGKTVSLTLEWELYPLPSAGESLADTVTALTAANGE